MAKTVKTDLHALSAKELQLMVVDLERSVQEARLRLAAGKLDKPSQIWQQAATLARVKTILREQELATVSGQ